MFENIFQALFSYRPVVFQQGDFRFDITTASFVAAGIAALIMGAAIFTYRTVGTNGRPRDRFVLTVLRMAALGLVVFCLFRPTLVVKAAIPQQNVVAVLMDDSRSMQIGDWDGKPRAEFLRTEFAGNTSPVLKSLSERFLVRTFRTTDGQETWDFGDGSPKVVVQSDGNVVPLAKDGYARTVHAYSKAGHYLVRVERTDRRGHSAVAHLQVRVGSD